MRLRVILIVELNKEGALSDVGRNALQLEGLESRPTEQSVMCRSEITEVLGEILVSEGGEGLLLCARQLGCCMLADSAVGWPVDFLAVW